LPTALPPPRGAARKRSRAQAVFDFLFNATLLVSALILAFIVLVREEQYAAFGQPERLVQTSVQPPERGASGANESLPPSR